MSLPPVPCELSSVLAPKLGVPSYSLSWGPGYERRSGLSPLPALTPACTSEFPLESPRWVPLGGKWGQKGAASVTTEGSCSSCCPSTTQGGFRLPVGPSPWASWEAFQAQVSLGFAWCLGRGNLAHWVPSGRNLGLGYLPDKEGLGHPHVTTGSSMGHHTMRR